MMREIILRSAVVLVVTAIGGLLIITRMNDADGINAMASPLNSWEASAVADPNPLAANWEGPYGGVPPFDRVQVVPVSPCVEWCSRKLGLPDPLLCDHSENFDHRASQRGLNSTTCTRSKGWDAPVGTFPVRCQRIRIGDLRCLPRVQWTGHRIYAVASFILVIMSKPPIAVTTSTTALRRIISRIIYHLSLFLVSVAPTMWRRLLPCRQYIVEQLWMYSEGSTLWSAATCRRFCIDIIVSVIQLEKRRQVAALQRVLRSWVC